MNAVLDQPTISNIQNDDVELDERDREAGNEELILKREDLEEDQGQVLDSTQEQVAPQLTEQEKQREEEYELKEKDETFQLNKTKWKEANPNDTLKRYKNLYVKGIINSLPWEENTSQDNYNVEGYTQNSEQTENTIFNKINKE